MHACDILGYTADADVYCPDCAEELYGVAALGKCPGCGRFTRTEQHGMFVCDHCGWKTDAPCLDGDRNEVHPIFADGDALEFASRNSCSVCHDPLLDE